MGTDIYDYDAIDYITRAEKYGLLFEVICEAVKIARQSPELSVGEVMAMACEEWDV